MENRENLGLLASLAAFADDLVSPVSFSVDGDYGVSYSIMATMTLNIISSGNPVVVHIAGGKFLNNMFFVVDVTVAVDLTVVSQ